MTGSDKSLFDFGPLAREYDRWYDTPTGQLHDAAQKKDVGRFLRRARAGETLLDVGCGTGHWSAFFAEWGYRVTGVDVAPAMIAAARAAVPGCTFQVADARRLPFEDASFDVVASMAVLEFVGDPVPVVREMVRCTRPGGTLLVGTLNRLAPLNQQRVSEGKEPYASAYLFSPGELRELLAPWGRTRMMVSWTKPPEDKRSEQSPVAQDEPSHRQTQNGPFIVAEVRL
ncbi:MAG TPA: SAM-dependent methyltransferase [Phycisphaerales bacterium]|nr:SAM-dependent methyltransferase [Phycisphaerales bacterium]